MRVVEEILLRQLCRKAVADLHQRRIVPHALGTRMDEEEAGGEVGHADGRVGVRGVVGDDLRAEHVFTGQGPPVEELVEKDACGGVVDICPLVVVIGGGVVS